MPASGATKHPAKPKAAAVSYDQCYQRALNFGLHPGQSGHNDYIHECMSGKAIDDTRGQGCSTL
jgi:hypothetical protein